MKVVLLYNQHHTIWNRTTTRYKYQYTSIHLQRMPNQYFISRVRTSERISTTDTNIYSINVVFSLATDIWRASKSWSTASGTAFSGWLNKIVCILTLQHSNQMVAKFWNRKPQLCVHSCILALYVQYIFIRGYFIHTHTHTASSIKVKHCSMPIFFSWQSAPLLSISLVENWNISLYPVYPPPPLTRPGWRKKLSFTAKYMLSNEHREYIFLVMRYMSAWLTLRSVCCFHPPVVKYVGFIRITLCSVF